MATTYTFTLRAGVTLVDASVYYNGSRYDIDAQLAAGGGSIITTDENLASLLKQQRVSDGLLLDVNGVPGSPDPALTPLLPVYGPSGSLTIAQVTALQSTLDANATTARTYADSVGGGVELGYAQITASPAAIGTTTTDIAGLAITVTVGARPIWVEMGGQMSVSLATGLGVIQIMEGATVLQQASLGIGHPANSAVPFSKGIRLAPSAGSHTYKVAAFSLVAGTVAPGASATAPLYIAARQL